MKKYQILYTDPHGLIDEYISIDADRGDVIAGSEGLRVALYCGDDLCYAGSFPPGYSCRITNVVEEPVAGKIEHL